MLQPKRVKYRKAQRGRMKGTAHRGATLAFGDFGLKALEPCWLTNRQIEAGRVALTRAVKRGGKIWIRIFPDKPFTKKPAETRMGKGKGNPEYWVAVVKPGRILYEMEGKAKLRDLSEGELGQKARELREEVFNLRFQVSMAMAKNPARIGQARRELARVQTLLRERALGLRRG